MKGMIFAAGIGSRLKPWTDSHPKALMPLAGRPALQGVIDRFIHAGVTDIVVNVHHFADQIREHLLNTEYSANIMISDESGRLLDTGGGLRKAIQFLDGDEPVLVHNADILSDFPILSLLKAHLDASNDITLATQARESNRRLVFDNQSGLLKGWINLTSGQTKPRGFSPDGTDVLACYNGAFIISPSMFPLLLNYAANEEPFSIIDFFISNAGISRIGRWNLPSECAWFDIGTPEKLEKANIYLATHKDNEKSNT